MQRLEDQVTNPLIPPSGLSFVDPKLFEPLMGKDTIAPMPSIEEVRAQLGYYLAGVTEFNSRWYVRWGLLREKVLTKEAGIPLGFNLRDLLMVGEYSYPFPFGFIKDKSYMGGIIVDRVLSKNQVEDVQRRLDSKDPYLFSLMCEELLTHIWNTESDIIMPKLDRWTLFREDEIKFTSFQQKFRLWVAIQKIILRSPQLLRVKNRSNAGRELILHPTVRLSVTYDPGKLPISFIQRDG